MMRKKTWLDISWYLMSRNEDDTGHFIERVITQDETWVHQSDPDSKKHSKQWKHPGSSPPKKLKIVYSAVKVVASIFWDSQGVIMIDYPELGVHSMPLPLPGQGQGSGVVTNDQ